jgi:hypothetical protein
LYERWSTISNECRPIDPNLVVSYSHVPRLPLLRILAIVQTTAKDSGGRSISFSGVLSSDVEVLLNIFALEPWFLLSSLVVSDCFHSMFVTKASHAECKEEVLDDEMI